MLRLILFGIFLIIFLNEQKINAVQELYGQSSGRIKSPFKIQDNFLKEYAKQQYKSSRFYQKSPTFIQSRHFHLDQLARDNRDLGQPSSYQSQISSSYYYTYGGLGTNLAGSSPEGCHLTNNYCSRDYQCCSGKCRCVRWSVMGKMSCWKKCF